MTEESKLLFTGSDWTFDSINLVAEEVKKIAREELKFDPYELQIEMISSDQMLDAYASHALPIYYNHWSFGKRHIIDQNQYDKGYSGLAYEIISNVSPASIAYLMENNTMTLQTLVLAHCQGHAHFFKNNYLFKETQADAIVDYMKFAKEFILKCEERHGVREVEEILDSCHALQNHGIDRYKRPALKSKQKRIEDYQQKLKYAEEFEDEIWKMVPEAECTEVADIIEEGTLGDPEENLLYFLEKNSPILKPWQKEIVRIVRKISQYFHPQRQTQVMNEGTACFGHYHIMNKLYDKGMISEGNMLEFLENHSAVIYQSLPDFRTDEEKKRDQAKGKRVIPYSGINPYALGFAMFQDIKRICENPTEEDKEWFPDIIFTDPYQTIVDIVANYRDESFIRQFLSPKLMRDFKFFSLSNNESDPSKSNINDIHNEAGYRKIRNTLADTYDFNLRSPYIQVVRADMQNDRKLYMKHYSVNNRLLDESVGEVLTHIKTLWGYDCCLDSLDQDGDIQETFDTEDM